MFHQIETGPCVVCDADTPATCECADPQAYDYDPTEHDLANLYCISAISSRERRTNAQNQRAALRDGRL